MLAVAILLNSAALSSTLWLGQISLFLAVPVTLAWRARRLGRWREVAAWIGVAASVKPFLLIVFPYLLLERQWRAAAWGGVLWAASFAVGAAVFGPAALGQWFEAAQWPTLGVSLPQRVLPRVRGARHVGVAGEIVASMGSGLGILATVWLAHKSDPDAAWALLMTGALLWAPLGWVYYEWIIVPPLAALIVDRRIPRAAWLLVVACVWPITGHAVRVTGTFLDAQVIGSIYFWGLLGLWLLLCSSAITRAQVPALARHAEST